MGINKNELSENGIKIAQAISDVEDLLNSTDLTVQESTILNMGICMLAERVVEKIGGKL